MAARFRKSISLALFVIFMANMGVWSFHTQWLSHALAHTTDAVLMVASADHSAQDHAAVGGKKAPSAEEHQLLHAADHLQLFPGTVPLQDFVSHTGTVPIGFRLSAATPVDTEPLFRPPCSTPLLA